MSLNFSVNSNFFHEFGEFCEIHEFCKLCEFCKFHDHYLGRISRQPVRKTVFCMACFAYSLLLLLLLVVLPLLSY